MSWIETYHHHKIDFADPDPEQIDIRDIVHVLPRIGRYNEHTPKPYSVAQHSVIMSLIVPEPHKPWALLHDAAEAYMGDVPAPLKQMCPEIQAAEERLLRTIAEAFDLDWPMPETIGQADLELLKAEYDQVTDHQRDWPSLEGVPEVGLECEVLSESQARGMYVVALHEVGLYDSELLDSVKTMLEDTHASV